jgi:hypothetical protein
VAEKSSTNSDDIIRRIVDELKPLRSGKGRSEIELAVLKNLEGSRWIVMRYSRAAIRTNRTHIKKLCSIIDQLIEHSWEAPRPVQISMFSGMSLGAPYQQLVFLNELREMRRRLTAADMSASRDAIKIASAETSRDLLLFHSATPPINSSGNSPIRIIASLVYEYFTRMPEQDLERACKDAMRKVHRHPILLGQSRAKIS